MKVAAGIFLIIMGCANVNKTEYNVENCRIMENKH